MRSIIVLPTFNERENIEVFLRAVRHVSERDRLEIDVLVVDDASPDGTADVAEALAPELGGIDVLRRAGKEGLGSAYRAGFERALERRYDAVISMDADMSHDPEVVPALLNALAAGADVAIGSRYVAGGATADWPVHRRMLSKWGNRYTRSVLRVPVADCTSGFRAYRESALRVIEPHTTEAEGYAFLTELARRVARKRLTVVETPIVFRDRQRGSSKMSSAIILESMWLVTRWGVRDLLRRRR